MSPKEYAQKLRSLAESLPEIAETVLVTEAQSGLSIVKNRSINDGIFEDSKDGALVDYSTNKMRTSKFKGKERNKAGTDYIASNRLGTWHEFRKAQGLKSEKVNLSYTNRFWTSISIVKKEKTARGALVIIAPSNPEEIEKGKDLFNRYGNFLIPTEDEKKDLIKDSFSNFVLEIKKRLSK